MAFVALCFFERTACLTCRRGKIDVWDTKHGICTLFLYFVFCLATGWLTCRQEKIDFWDNVYGFDMSSIKERALIEPLVDNVDPEQIATNSHQIKSIDILSMTVADANFEVHVCVCQRYPIKPVVSQGYSAVLDECHNHSRWSWFV